jgi:hypothetical protein
MSRRSERGASSLGTLVLLLLVLVAGVAWNYHRNLAAEEREFRPYRSYSDADLAALLGAYEQESKTTRRRYDAALDRRANVQAKSDVMGNVGEFERAQRVRLAARDARSNHAEAQASLEGLRAEEAHRGGDRSALGVFLRRAFSF